MDYWFWGAFGVVLFVAVSPARHLLIALPAWLDARREGLDIGLRKLAGYSLAKASPRRLVRSFVRFRKAGIEAEMGELAVLETSGVSSSDLADVIEARRRQGLSVELYALSAVALEGQLDAHGMAPNPVKSMIDAKTRADARAAGARG